jgi:F-type H+-transporting ATPase subunit b
MPQMDSVTYLSQVTWFVVVFGLYYIIMVADVLPALDRVLKIRVKKLALTRGDARHFDRERVQADEGYGRALAGAASSSVGLLMACQDTQSTWANDAVASIRQGNGARAQANAQCVRAMVRTTASSLALASLLHDVTITEDDVTDDASVDWIETEI